MPSGVVFFLRDTPQRSHIANVFASPRFRFRERLAFYGSYMPKPGGAYIIDDEWRRRVREAIAEMVDENGKAMSEAKFAKRAGIAKSSLSEALSPTSVQTSVMPQIHAALGWEPPRLVIAPDTLEALAQFDALSDFKKGEMLEKLRAEAARERARNPKRR